MKKRPSLALALALSLFAQIGARGQNPQPNAPPPAPPQQAQQQQPPATDDDEVVRITTNLVQVDAVITDKKGKLVTDLRPEEIEIYEDGRPQKISNFSFVSMGSTEVRPAAPAPAAPVDKSAPPVPPVALKPEQVRRTIALVVDDLGLSFESTYRVREALKKFVEKQMEPGDLVAIIRTGGGMGALQQFTSDRRQLLAAIERVKWNMTGRGGVAAFAPIEQDPLKEMGASNASAIEEDDRDSKGEDIDALRQEFFTVGTLGAVNYVVRGMRGLPGRKSILLVSDGFRIFDKDDQSRSSRMLEALNRLTDLANRSSVVIYTMDARGLQTLGLTAADSVSASSASDIEDALADRREEFFETQNGLNYLARQTGGIPIRNTNDLSSGIRRVLNDQSGYYLIGYRPDESTFDQSGRRKFHRITIKLKRPGLSYRSRSGFYGISNEEPATARRTLAQQLIGAIVSPFASGGVHLRLTSIFGNDQKAGSFVRSLLHVDARDLTFTDEPDGFHKAVFDILAMTFGDNGTVIDQVARTHTMRVRGESYERILKNGFVYHVTVPVKKPGAYQLRAALRDSASERLGSASQFIEVPDIKKNRLTLSGLVVSGIQPSAKQPAAAQAGGAPQPKAEGDSSGEPDPLAGPGVRKFRRGMLMQYSYIIYNAQADKATGRPQLQAQMRLFRDGKQVFLGRVQQLDTSRQPDLKRVLTGGGIQIGSDMAPGDYTLQVVVTDPLSKEKYRTATQWIDFEIVK